MDILINSGVAKVFAKISTTVSTDDRALLLPKLIAQEEKYCHLTALSRDSDGTILKFELKTIMAFDKTTVASPSLSFSDISAEEHGPTTSPLSKSYGESTLTDHNGRDYLNPLKLLSNLKTRSKIIDGIKKNPQIFYQIHEYLDADDKQRLVNAFQGYKKAAVKLPIEITKQIFEYLDSAADFNSARKVCTSWYEGSFFYNIYADHLTKLGFKSDRTLYVNDFDYMIQLCKRFQMESDLGADGKSTVNLPLLITSYTANGEDYSGCTFSRCQRFFIAYRGRNMLIFKINGQSLQLYWTIVSPRNVVTVSMDTSYNRVAIAALLEGRIGIVFDLLSGRLTNIYREIGRENDPPMSIAIGPQRRCVAFGCRTVLDLRWVDNTCKNQVLFFLPSQDPPPTDPNPGITRLRMIASALRPDSVQRNPVELDHFETVPTSDSRLMLFINGRSQQYDNYLCLGCQAPGRLSREFQLIAKVVFLGPERDEFLRPRGPHCFAVAPDLRRGMRVAAGFDDDIWLFTIPPDTLATLKDKIDKSFVTEGIEALLDFANEDEILIWGKRLDSSIGRVSKIAISTEDNSEKGALYIHCAKEDGTIYTFGPPGLSNGGERHRVLTGDGTFTWISHKGKEAQPKGFSFRQPSVVLSSFDGQSDSEEPSDAKAKSLESFDLSECLDTEFGNNSFDTVAKAIANQQLKPKNDNVRRGKQMFHKLYELNRLDPWSLFTVLNSNMETQLPAETATYPVTTITSHVGGYSTFMESVARNNALREATGGERIRLAQIYPDNNVFSPHADAVLEDYFTDLQEKFMRDQYGLGFGDASSDSPGHNEKDPQDPQVDEEPKASGSGSGSGSGPN